MNDDEVIADICLQIRKAEAEIQWIDYNMDTLQTAYNITQTGGYTKEDTETAHNIMNEFKKSFNVINQVKQYLEDKMETAMSVSIYEKYRELTDFISRHSNQWMMT